MFRIVYLSSVCLDLYARLLSANAPTNYPPYSVQQLLNYYPALSSNVPFPPFACSIDHPCGGQYGLSVHHRLNLHNRVSHSLDLQMTSSLSKEMRNENARLLWSDSLSAARALVMWKGREGLEMRQRVVLERRAVRVRNDMLQKLNCLGNKAFSQLQKSRGEGC